ncbi:MAG: beta-lactamase [Symbiobacteriaceae bacterium]|nr:beta-lactamase [Symbiobacteriaceae bacterium]
MGRTKLSSVTIALVEGDQVIYQRGFGLANREKGIPASPRSNYCIGSVTKSFTSLAIMQLQEQGLLSVDDPVERFLPLRVRPFGEDIRIRHLMSHTSGLPALAYLENVLRYHHGAFDRYLPMGGVDDMLSFVNGADDWVEAKPGERWFYLNEGYVLLGAIIEKVSGIKYADYIQEKILRPLDMIRSFHQREMAKQDLDMAVPYALDNGKHVASDYPWGQAEPDGGLISNVQDMARYVQMYLSGGKGIVSQASLDAMAAPAVRTPPEDVATGEPASYYGFGLGTSDFYGRRLVGHTGMMYVATAAMRFLPEQKIGAVVLANGTGYALANIADFALATLLGEDPWQIPALRTEQILDDLTGMYETYRGTFATTVRRKGDNLVLEFKTKHSEDAVTLVPAELDAEHPRFYTYGGGRRQVVEFHRRAGGVELIHERYKFKRIGRLPS